MSLLPKTATSTQSSAAPSAGSLIAYENQGACLIGAVLEFKKPKYTVLNERGAEVDLAPDRLHLLPAKLPSSTAAAKDKTVYLAELSKRSRETALSVDLSELWSFICQEDKGYQNHELCELYYGKNELASHLALRLALIADSVYFKRKNEFFHPRSPEVVEELKKAEEVKLHKLQLQDLTLSAFAQRMGDPRAPLPKEVDRSLSLLEELAGGIPNMEHSRQKEVKELLALCIDKLKLELTGRREEQAYSLLRKLGHFGPFTNLAIIRNGIKTRFPETVLREAETIVPPRALEECTDRDIRVDLTQLAAFTIDDHSTKDMDDAISLENTSGGFRLGIHISDVASQLPLDSTIDREAKARFTSLYFPDGAINMLPEKLSQDVCSLIKDEVRPCLSCLWEVDRNFNLSQPRIVPSLLKVKRRLTYGDVDDLLESNDPELSVLYNIASSREMERYKLGGYKVNKREVWVAVKPEGELELIEVDENAPGRSLIGELMVLCNELIADVAVTNRIPIVFRGQEASEPLSEAQRARIPAGPAADYAMRATLKPSTVSFDAAPHATLGSKAYTQASSPIRRYIDLCNQRQMLWFLRTGKPLFTRSEYKNILDDTDESRVCAGIVTKETRRFWILKYLEQRMKTSSTIQATVLRTDMKTPLVELEEVYLPTLVRLPQDLKPGDVINLRIARIDAAFDELRLELIR